MEVMAMHKGFRSRCQSTPHNLQTPKDPMPPTVQIEIKRVPVSPEMEEAMARARANWEWAVEALSDAGRELLETAERVAEEQTLNGRTRAVVPPGYRATGCGGIARY